MILYDSVVKEKKKNEDLIAIEEIQVCEIMTKLCIYYVKDR